MNKRKSRVRYTFSHRSGWVGRSVFTREERRRERCPDITHRSTIVLGSSGSGIKFTLMAGHRSPPTTFKAAPGSTPNSPHMTVFMASIKPCYRQRHPQLSLFYFSFFDLAKTHTLLLLLRGDSFLGAV